MLDIQARWVFQLLSFQIQPCCGWSLKTQPRSASLVAQNLLSYRRPPIPGLLDAPRPCLPPPGNGFILKKTVENSSNKPLVFVVDDEPLLIELAAALLEPAGYAIQTFRDADSALQAYKSAEAYPQVILTDYAMHRMTGLDLVRECRKINPRQKIIMVSGTVDEKIFQTSRFKPDHFLAKPYQGKQLISLIESVLAD